jgi:outer membrane protease
MRDNPNITTSFSVGISSSLKEKVYENPPKDKKN